jgi:hypothetical protein
LFNSQPFSLACVVDISHSLSIAGKKIRKPFVVTVRSQ